MTVLGYAKEVVAGATGGRSPLALRPHQIHGRFGRLLNNPYTLRETPSTRKVLE